VTIRNKNTRMAYYRATCHFFAGVERHRIGELADMRGAMNQVTRVAYVQDCDVGVQRWNRLVAEAGCDLRFRLPSTRFHRSIACGAAHRYTPRDARLPRRKWRLR
jgi:benzoyl-CoA 2,3-dioxygenase component B